MSGRLTVRELISRWEDARWRTFRARHDAEGAADYWTELRVGAKIAREVTAGRWCVVAALLRSGAVASWAEVGDALGVTEVEARDGFRGWIDGQVDLYRNTAGAVGMTPAEADSLSVRAEAVIL